MFTGPTRRTLAGCVLALLPDRARAVPSDPPAARAGIARPAAAARDPGGRGAPVRDASPQDALARDWRAFAARFVSAEGRVLDTFQNGASHSEGQGWGMLFAHRAGDRAGFERIAGWTARAMRRPQDRLHAWRVGGGFPPDANNATDGDIFIAAALIEAGRAWQRPEWQRTGAAVARDVLRFSTREAGGRLLLLPGTAGFERPGAVTVNPSYYAFPLLRVLAGAVPDTAWLRLIPDGLRLLRAARFGPRGLTADWVSVPADGGAMAPDPRWPARFSYDAVRVPLWLAWAGLTDEPVLAATVAAWSALSDAGGGAARALPAAIDLASGQGGPEPALPGMAEVAALSAARLAGRPVPPPPPLDLSNYYSASLAMLARIAAAEERGRPPEALDR